MIWTQATKISIEVRVMDGTVWTLSNCDIINLLSRTIFTFQIWKVPIFWVGALNTLFLIPKVILALVTSTDSFCRVKNLPSLALYTLFIVLIFSCRTKLTMTIDNIVEGGILTEAGLFLRVIDQIWRARMIDAFEFTNWKFLSQGT